MMGRQNAPVLPLPVSAAYRKWAGLKLETEVQLDVTYHQDIPAPQDQWYGFSLDICRQAGGEGEG